MIRRPGQKADRRFTRGEAHQLANMLKRYFAPSSIMPAPGSDPTSTGNRNTIISARNAVNSAPTDSAILRMENGIARWHYKTKFGKQPVSRAIGITGTVGTPREIFCAGLGTTDSVIFMSSDNTDDRMIFAHAIESTDA